MRINALVEGPVDESVVERVLRSTGHELADCWGKQGSAFIRDHVQQYATAARTAPLLVVVDQMDTRLECPPQVAAAWLPHRPPGLVFCVAVREVESWLLADRNGVAELLRIRVGRIPKRPDEIDDPKRCLVALARQSRSSTVKRMFVPAANSTAQVGRLYTTGVQEFASSRWSIDDARRLSPSLNRCVERLSAIDRV